MATDQSRWLKLFARESVLSSSTPASFLAPPLELFSGVVWKGWNLSSVVPIGWNGSQPGPTLYVPDEADLLRQCPGINDDCLTQGGFLKS